MSLKVCTLFFALTVFFFSCSKSKDPAVNPVEPPTGSETVPPAYQSVYNWVMADLKRSDSLVTSIWDGTKHCAAYTIDVDYASTITYKTQLLNPVNLQNAYYAIDAYADGGISGVRLDVGYPFLVPGFPNQNQYLLFFKNVVNRARAKGLKVFIKSTNTPYHPSYGGGDPVVNAFVDGKNRQQYLNEKRQMLQIIIDSLHPDYLTLENEPTSMEAACNFPFDFSPDSVKYMLSYYLAGLNKSGVKLGAGCGNWESPEFVLKFSQVPLLDFVDLHVFPVMGELFASNFKQRCDIVKQYGKELVFGECWLRKITASETTLAVSEMAKRDLFSFWRPADSTFMAVLSKYSQHYKAGMITMYNGDMFFGYLKYQQGDESLNITQLKSRLTPVQESNLAASKLDPVFTSYKKIMQKACF